MEAQHLAYPDKEAAQSGNTHASSTMSGGSGFTTSGSESTTAGGDMARIVPHRVRDRESGSPMPPFHDESATDSKSGRLWSYLPPMSKFLDILKPSQEEALREQDGNRLVLDEHERKPSSHDRKPDVRGDQPGKRRATLTDIHLERLDEIDGLKTQRRMSGDGNRKSEPVTNISGQWCNDVTETSKMPGPAVSESHARPLSPLDSVTSISDTYSRLMLVHSLGYPLYMPELDPGLPKEYRRKGLRIGDVGRITSAGAFDFLFNTCSPTNHPINPSVLPDNFEVLPLNDTSIHENFFAPETFLLSDNVDEKDDQFHCTGVEGAVLALPEGGTLFEAQNTGIFQEHAARHAESWYKYTTGYKGRKPANGSLYLITGCIKSRTWGIATFYRGPTPGNYLQFISNDVPPGSASNAQATYRWQKSGRVIARIGPNSEGTCELNQCVFLYGYKIMLHQDVWDTLQCPVSDPSREGEQRPFSAGEGKKPLHATAGNSPLKSHHPSMDNKTVQNQNMSASMIASDFFNAASPTHPLDFINAILLRSNPRARVALTHDTIWCDTLRKRFASGHFNFDIDKILAHISDSYVSSLDEFGCISLTSKTGGNAEASTRTVGDKSGSPCLSLPGDTLSSPHSSIHISHDEDRDDDNCSDDMLDVESDYHLHTRKDLDLNLPFSIPGSMRGESLRENAHGESMLPHYSRMSPTPSEHSLRLSSSSLSKRPRMAKPMRATRGKSGCYTCRIRRKRCDEQITDGSCQTCRRLRLECLGFGVKRPDWLREREAVSDLRNRITSFLTSQGLVRGHSGRTLRDMDQESSFLQLRPDSPILEVSPSIPAPQRLSWVDLNHGPPLEKPLN